jgi:hypothetical protein
MFTKNDGEVVCGAPPDGAGEKYEKRVGPAKEMGNFSFLLRQNSKIFVYLPILSEFHRTVALITSPVMIGKQPGKGVTQPRNL